MTTQLSVLASWNDVTGARCISFGGNYVAAQRRIKRSPEGKIRSPREREIWKNVTLLRVANAWSLASAKKVACSAFVLDRIYRKDRNRKGRIEKARWTNGIFHQLVMSTDNALFTQSKFDIQHISTCIRKYIMFNYDNLLSHPIINHRY